ncbi:MAG TPA: glycosyltransferase family 87 protein [Phycisphaerae bacterium]|nr:glycosyltransferase family 87 protein [Phycisphaerae bacterium]
MTSDPRDWMDRLPYTTPRASDPRAKPVRAAAYLLLAAALVVPVVQFQVLTVRNLAQGADSDEGKSHKGAIGRWRLAVHEFWAGKNIYAPADACAAPAWRDQSAPPSEKVWLHPNTPLVVLLISPLALLPVWAMALAWNVLKLAVLAGSILGAARLAAHRERRTSDWVIGLALLWGALLIIGDIQHGNTNVFVLGAIVLHLWAYRRGNDFLAGAPLALAVCLKMTPALFLLYWLYQRNWKLLAGTAVFGILLAVALPWAVLAAAFGPGHFVALAGTWLDQLIVPGLLKGAWYPVHINQSIPGVFSRYFLSGPDGDIFWNPDDWTYEAFRASGKPSGWITVAALSPATVKWMIRAAQALVVLLAAWAIGWRKLPRDDGRRALHYGLVLLGMMLLNQRTWDHHAAVLLPMYVAVWHALGYGRMARAARIAALALVLAAGPLVWLSGTGFAKLAAVLSGHALHKGDHWADLADAYGPTCLHFLLMFAASVVLAVALRRSDAPYADRRQPLRAR